MNTKWKEEKNILLMFRGVVVELGGGVWQSDSDSRLHRLHSIFLFHLWLLCQVSSAPISASAKPSELFGRVGIKPIKLPTPVKRINPATNLQLVLSLKVLVEKKPRWDWRKSLALAVEKKNHASAINVLTKKGKAKCVPLYQSSGICFTAKRKRNF